MQDDLLVLITITQFCFSTNQHEYFYSIICQSARYCWRRLLTLSLYPYKEKQPNPLGAMFFDQSSWTKGITQGIFLQRFLQIGQYFRSRIFLSFHFSYIRRNSLAPRWLCCTTNQHGLKEPDRGSHKEDFFKLIWKSAKDFQKRGC